MVERLADLPFLPVVAWGFGQDEWAGIGLGDLLFATVFPLVMRKAYGKRAGQPRSRSPWPRSWRSSPSGWPAGSRAPSR